MAGPLSGPGLGLQLPQYLYPSELNLAPYDIATNRLALNAGDSLVLPRGRWAVGLGMYSILQFLDPVTGAWTTSTGCGWTNGPLSVDSDGFNVRVANLTGCMFNGVVAGYGSGYVQASTTVVPSVGNSTWLPIVGGQLSVVSVTAAGSGYGIAPLVFIPAPPPASTNANGVGGRQASAYAVISSGTVSGVTLTDPGAGYPSAPTVTILPNPFDPNLSSGITPASVTLGVVGSGSITGVILTNSGAPIAAASLTTASLTVAGAGSGATVSPNIMQIITTASVTTAGVGYPATGNFPIFALGGQGSVGTITNVDTLRLTFRPRPAQIGVTSNAGGSVTVQAGTIYDGGLFLSAPTPSIYSPATVASIAVVALTMGSTQDVVILQPLG